MRGRNAAGRLWAGKWNNFQIEYGEQFLDGEFVMGGHGFQDTAQQGAGFQRAMIWNRDMVRPTHGGCQADVRALLPHAVVSEPSQSAGEVGRVDVAWDFHVVRASSRTKCKWMIRGIEPGTASPK